MSIENNFKEASKLSHVASAQIQSVLRCLLSNTTSRVQLSQADPENNAVYFSLQGDFHDLHDCCALRNVTIEANEAQTEGWLKATT